MSNPTISVIVPVYNTENYLRRCIDSILAQTFTDFELLLIDDGSKDNSGTICDEYALKDSRIRVFHKKNGGVSSARNLGIRESAGTWITFVDSDDWVGENWLDLYANNICDDNDLIVQGYDYSLENSRDHFSHSGFEFFGGIKEGTIKLYENNMPGSSCNKLFISKIIKEQGILFDSHIRLQEDEDFVLRYLLNIKKMKAIREGSYKYVMPNYQSKYGTTDGFYAHCKIFNSLSAIFNNNNCDFLESAFVKLSNEYFDLFRAKRDNLTNCTKYYLEAIDDYPINSKSLSKLTIWILKNIRQPRLIAFLFNTKHFISTFKH